MPKERPTTSRRKDYGQEAVVAQVTTRPGAVATAWERFTPEGPLALLPLDGRYGAVWGARPDRARELCELTEAAFLAALSRAFGRRAGAFVAAGARSRMPLALRVRATRIGERSAFIGNAAQTLHPVAGQGLNLGLRDAWDLAQVLQGAEDPGDARVLQALCRIASLRCDGNRARDGFSRRGLPRCRSLEPADARFCIDCARHLLAGAAFFCAPHDLRNLGAALNGSLFEKRNSGDVARRRNALEFAPLATHPPKSTDATRRTRAA